MLVPSSKTISTILKHDAKVTTYKIALLRSINDVVLSFPDLRTHDRDVAVPLRTLAQFWVAYYWPFVQPGRQIMQGPRSRRGQALSYDMAFRGQLLAFRQQWETLMGGGSRPSDGFFVVNQIRVPRKRASYPPQLLETFYEVIQSISKTIEMPIRYAGPDQWSVFAKPGRLETLQDVVPIPGSTPKDVCLVISSSLWQTFREVSLWVEALCIHEWCLFTEKVEQDPNLHVDRGDVYRLLTDRQDNRRPLTWEHNNIDILLMEGKQFICPWTERRIHDHVPYDLDHIVPMAIYPTNELWNLVPSDPHFNQQVKSDRLPSAIRLARAQFPLTLTYSNYNSSEPLSSAIHEDAALRFSTVQQNDNLFPDALAMAVIDFISQFAESRNLARF
jgi:hypothetical protein